MTDPITPPPELVQQWINEEDGLTAGHIATQAAQWGADMELEACCEWLENQTLCGHRELIPSLRRLRRPKPPSLKEQALYLLANHSDRWTTSPHDRDLVRRALEALDD